MSLLKKINIAIAGATGFVGLDLINILIKHPKVNIINICARKNIGKRIQFFDKRIKKNLPRISKVESDRYIIYIIAHRRITKSNKKIIKI